MNTFWQKPERWPRDPDGFVFLARAVLAIGRAKFGTDWAPSDYLAGAEAIEVQQLVVSSCESGTLHSSFRDEDSGKMFEMQPRVWNTDSWRSRFARCRMDPWRPMSNSPDGLSYQWIFISKRDLDDLLKSITAPPGEREAAPVLDVTGSGADDRWPIPEQQPSGRRSAAAWRTMKRIWGKAGGVPRGMSFQEVADIVNDNRVDRTSPVASVTVSDETIRRILCQQNSTTSATNATSATNSTTNATSATNSTTNATDC
jgi:hypothetical protein